MKPKVSVIVPVYNAEGFLQDCIDSLLNQTLEEIEIILVNDASTDNSIEILRRNQKLFPNKIKIIDSKMNLRQGGARNLGIREAKADYIAFVDNDDIIAPTMLEKMYAKISKCDCDFCYIKNVSILEKTSYADICSENAEAFITAEGAWDNNRIQRYDSVEISDAAREEFIVNNVGSILGSMWKTKTIIENSLYFPEHIIFEDNYWWLLANCYIRKACYINETGYYYRTVAQSSSRARNASYYWDRITVMDLLWKELKERNIFEKYYIVWEYMSMINCFNTYFVFMHKFDIPPKKLIKNIPQSCLGEFPNWKKNPFYRANVRLPRRMKYAIIAKMPIVMLYIHPLFEKVTKIFSSIGRPELT